MHNESLTLHILVVCHSSLYGGQRKDQMTVLLCLCYIGQDPCRLHYAYGKKLILSISRGIVLVMVTLIFLAQFAMNNHFMVLTLTLQATKELESTEGKYSGRLHQNFWPLLLLETRLDKN